MIGVSRVCRGRVAGAVRMMRLFGEACDESPEGVVFELAPRAGVEGVEDGLEVVGVGERVASAE